MNHKKAANLKRITILYLFAAAIILVTFIYAIPDSGITNSDTLQYISGILGGLLTMTGVYYAFADSEKDRDIENTPRFSADLTAYPARANDRVFVFFGGHSSKPKRHLQLSLHNEGSTEINIIGIFVGKSNKEGKMYWLPYKSYRQVTDNNERVWDMALINENLDINSSLKLFMDVSSKIPTKDGTEDPARTDSRTRFTIEVWYKNDYSDIFYQKKYQAEHLPLEQYDPQDETYWDRCVSLHAYSAKQSTEKEFNIRCRNAEEYSDLIKNEKNKKKVQ